jgi:hypothetical protein
MSARFATNKTVLARCLRISMTLLYEYMRLPDAPAPCADGRWSVTAYRRFIAAHSKQVKAPNEKEALLIRKLQLQCEREEFALRETRQTTRKKILDELTPSFVAAVQLIRTELFKMKNELCPRFEGQSAREIYRLWTNREGEAFKNVTHELNKRTGGRIEEKDTRPAVKVVPFERRGVAG